MSQVLDDIESYYTNKITEHGVSPRGVDWKDESSQVVRFQQLLRIIGVEPFTLGDLGCGYGKLYDSLTSFQATFEYTGYDLSQDMIDAAKEKYNAVEGASFLHIKTLDELAKHDYFVESGIFNVKMSHDEQTWHSYMMETLHSMNDKSIKGFAFNALTKYSDKAFMRSDLYYADPLYLFDYCKKNFSKDVALLHDYGLYEFTILVRKDT